MPNSRCFVPATVHGYYLVDQPVLPADPPLMVGFHGYGEHAERQLERLRGVPGAERYMLVSIQALHPFYPERDGEVGASWMTRFDRERAIEDNVAYVRTVLSEVMAERKTTALVYAGFSQGVAMAFRAAARVGLPASAVLACGGDVPPDLKSGDGRVWAGMTVLLGRGTRDDWYTEAKLEGDVAYLGTQGALVEQVVFEGEHEWSEAFCQAAGKVLGSAGRG